MKSRTWSLLSLLLFVAAIFFWLKGNERQAREIQPPASYSPTGTTSGVSSAAPLARPFSLLSGRSLVSAGKASPAKSQVGALFQSVPANTVATNAPLRVANTRKTIDELSRSDQAILLRNALIDTVSGAPLEIPDHLRAGSDPGAYIVQARGNVNDAFRASLASNGGTIVSYIPNDAYLVRLSPDGAQAMAAAPFTQAVVPYEPYYKLDHQLLPLAIQQSPIPDQRWLNVIAYPGEAGLAIQDLQALGATVLSQANTPFGPEFVVEPEPNSLVALAALPSVQLLEAFERRAPMNDLTRIALGIEVGGTNSVNYLGLKGSNVWVNINDTGVDSKHPDLAPRVFADNAATLTDLDGHGTHVAGTIASSGTNSPTVNSTNVPGSSPGANFHGMAPEAKLFALPIDLLTGPLQSDTYLIETAARTNYVTLARTNVLLSNNSWGYPGDTDYDTAAATYDAATRDALPDLPGSQSVLYIFAAGNSGNGTSTGVSGDAGTITSPATGKNVVTVGATDSPRFITNDVAYFDSGQLVTNQVILGQTDSDDEIAFFSSRGNVGIGTESLAGRFKPDVVAPGGFIISTKPKDWVLDLTPTNGAVTLFPNQTIAPSELNNYAVDVPDSTTNLIIELLPNRNSPTPFPQLPIYLKYGDFPTTNDFKAFNRVVLTGPQAGTWYYSIGDTVGKSVTFDIRVTLELSDTADSPISFPKVLDALDAPLKDYYRYDYGTSMAAGAVSGLLALMEEFFDQHLKQSYSPALLKALLINGARTLGPQYNLQVRNQINYQGWGIANIQNSLPGSLTNSLAGPLKWVDQSPTNALATGQAHTYQVAIPADATDGDLRVSLVWTDPPGNPASSIKLVNDLDLLVSNVVTHEVIAGNAILGKADYNAITPTNAFPLFDNVNNVENVFLRGPLTTNYTIHIIGRKVNVNAVTANTNNVVQDYALVVSLANSSSTNNAVTLVQSADSTRLPETVTRMTNGVPMLHQRVGANSPLLGGLNGSSNQWSFYVFTNTHTADDALGLTNGPYVAFVTFTPPELSAPRNDQADIDLYVTRGDPGLLSLKASSVANAYHSLTRLGTETVAFTNGLPGEIYYVGVKSEDQMGSEFGLVGISSDVPFDQTDPFGNHILRGLPITVLIPDGSPGQPQAALIFAIGVTPVTVGRVSLSELITHNEFGDLLGNLSHNSTFAVLNNHDLNIPSLNGIYNLNFDDSRSGDSPRARRSDGPGRLTDFMGQEGSGAWILTTIDNALGGTGTVQNVTIRVQKAPDLQIGARGTVLAGEFQDYFIDIPPDASKLTVTLTETTGPLILYLRHGDLPTTTEYDKFAKIPAPGGEISIGVKDIPPLIAGRYFISVFNPGTSTVSYFIRARIERNLSPLFRRDFAQTNGTRLKDDALTISTNFVSDARSISDIKVGIRVTDPRISDLAFRLVGPNGTSVLLQEDRGTTNWTAEGYQSISTNFHHVAVTYSTNDLGTAALYLDGELEVLRTNLALDLAGLRLKTTNDLYLGSKPISNSPPAQYLGLMDEVDLYSRALQSNEVRAIYMFGGAGKPTNELVSRWPFDGNGLDSQTNGNNATLVGGVGYINGEFNQGLQFLAAADTVRITNHAGLDVGAGKGFTLDAWIAPTDLSKERPLAVWRDNNGHAGVEWLIRPGPDTNIAPGQLCLRLVDILDRTNEATVSLQGIIATNNIVTNINYLTFTEDTNLAVVPIKFGNPATNAVPTYTNQLISGFENVVARKATNFVQGQIFDDDVNGWLVYTNEVTVLQAPSLSHTGTNLLALKNGWITRTLPTQAGHTYRLNIVHKQQPYFPGFVGWWPAEGDFDDVTQTNDGGAIRTVGFAPGKVGQGFLFATNSGYVMIPANPSLDLTNEMTIELWFSMTNTARLGGGLFGRGASPAGGSPDAANYGANIADVGLDLWYNDPGVTDPKTESPGSRFEVIRDTPAPSTNVFHHFAGTFKQITTNRVEMGIFLDGEKIRGLTLIGVLTNTVAAKAPLLIGATLAGIDGFTGIIDELTIFQRVLTPDEIKEIYTLDAVGKSRPPNLAATGLGIGRSSFSTFVSDVDWATNSVTFQADSNGTPITLTAIEPGVLLDSISLQEISATSFLPEESLKEFVGTTAAGTWRLEVVDNRVGITNQISPDLISWNLDITFAPPSFPAIQLTNGIPSTNFINPNSVLYFLVDVPLTATHATNIFGRANSLELWFNQNGIPGGDVGAGDIALITNSGTIVITTNQTYQADPLGDPILGSVSSTPDLFPGERYFLAVTNTGPGNTAFTIEVDFDGLDDLLRGLIRLTPDKFFFTNIVATNALQYFRYTVSSTNVQWASFELYPTNGNANLYIKAAQDVPNPLPTPFSFDYASENPGTNAEIIIVSQDSVIPLGFGDWLIGVLNADTNKVGYSVRVVESTNKTRPVIILTESVPVTDTALTGDNIRDYFLFQVPTNSSLQALQFDLYNLSGPADLILQHNGMPTPIDYLQLDHGAPGAPAKIVVQVNAAVPTLSGDWYLAVLSRDTGNVGFSIKASYPPRPPFIESLSSGVPLTRTIAVDTAGRAARIDYYKFTVSANAMMADFQVLPVNGDVDFVLSEGRLPDLTIYDLLSSNPGTTPESIRVYAGGQPVPLSKGDWYLGVYNRDFNSVTYQVMATEYAPVITPLQAGVPVTATIPPGAALDYYVYNVTTNATQATFSLANASGVVQLQSHYHLPLPDPYVFDYSVTATATNDAAITVDTNSLPVALAPGRWYLSVVNLDTVAVTYTIAANQIPSPVTSGVTFQFTFTAGTASFSWTTNPGLNFQVEYTTAIPPVWRTVPGTITSQTGVYQFQADETATGGPAPMKFFRLKLVP